MFVSVFGFAEKRCAFEWVFDHSYIMRPKELLWKLVAILRIEIQNKYSVQRVLQLTRYSKSTSALRRALVLTLTPIPCLAITLMLESIPLLSPSEGASANWAFQLRVYGMLIILTNLMVYRFTYYVQSLPFSKTKHAIVPVLVASGAMAIISTVMNFVAFPIPFSVVVASPIVVIGVLIGMALSWRREIYERYQELKPSFVKGFNAWSCQATFASIYPVFYYVYHLLTPRGRTALCLFLPMMKLIMRVWINSSVAHLQDGIPVLVVLDADIFNALFMVYCMQMTPSLTITAGLLVMDVAQSVLSLADIQGILNESREACKQLAQGKFVQVRESTRTMLTNTIDKLQLTRTNREVSCGPKLTRMSWWRSGPFGNASVGPMKMDAVEEFKCFSFEGELIPTPPSSQYQDAQVYVDATQRVLYVTEFLLLVNYVEVAVPLIYGKFMLRCDVAFHDCNSLDFVRLLQQYTLLPCTIFQIASTSSKSMPCRSTNCMQQ